MAAIDYCERIQMGVRNRENPLKTFILVARQPRTQMLQDITSD